MSVSKADLQGQLAELVAKHRVPGAVVAVWQDGELITAAAGLANLNTGVPMTADTAFLTGSITEGLGDDDVHDVRRGTIARSGRADRRYAPDIQFGADLDVARSLTFRNLVNHSSGVDSSDLFVPTRPFPEGVEDYLARSRKPGS